jgi:DNA-binding PadR family transcriptional regulator
MKLRKGKTMSKFPKHEIGLMLKPNRIEILKYVDDHPAFCGKESKAIFGFSSASTATNDLSKAGYMTFTTKSGVRYFTITEKGQLAVKNVDALAPDDPRRESYLSGATGPGSRKQKGQNKVLRPFASITPCRAAILLALSKTKQPATTPEVRRADPSWGSKTSTTLNSLSNSGYVLRKIDDLKRITYLITDLGKEKLTELAAHPELIVENAKSTTYGAAKTAAPELPTPAPQVMYDTVAQAHMQLLMPFVERNSTLNSIMVKVFNICDDFLAALEEEGGEPEKTALAFSELNEHNKDLKQTIIEIHQMTGQYLPKEENSDGQEQLSLSNTE